MHEHYFKQKIRTNHAAGIPDMEKAVKLYLRGDGSSIGIPIAPMIKYDMTETKTMIPCKKSTYVAR